MADQVNPNPGILLYTRIKKSPYYYASRRHGVQLYSVYNHHYHPRLYRDPVEEYWQLLEGVTLWDVGGAERQVEITGPDAFTFTNMLTPRNLHKCAVGQCKYAFITDQHGGIINDPVLIRLEENHFWLSLADSDVLLWCRGVAVNAGLDVHISEPDVGPLQVQGPKSKEVMTSLFGADILDVPYYYMVRRELDGMPLVITRTGYTGELGYEIYLSDASRHGVKLWDALLEAGEPHGLVPIGPSHIRRIEGGILAHGCDMTIDENPYEVGYGYKWMVELEQDQDFIGREALRRVHDEGDTRKLVGVEIGGSSLGAYNDGSMPDFFPVRAGGDIVGKVTSACHSPRLDKNIGFAMVSVEHSAEGVELEVERPEETAEAVVVDRVFFKPEHAEETLAAPGSASVHRPRSR
jgi:glycine cleavage system aminomethyltransferase T